MTTIDSLKNWDNRLYASQLKARGKSFSEVARSKSIYNQLAPWYDILISPGEQTVSDVDFLEGVFRAKLKQDSFRLIDLACGSGRHANLLAERGHLIIGVDSSPALLRYARKNGTATF
ncbi:MAG: class I SAM-dependent methyltransferase, partial [Acidobacteriota bacterium]|nr:class I SAM-dependent methyltransferase [Acidobacteriota bacterium]